MFPFRLVYVVTNSTKMTGGAVVATEYIASLAGEEGTNLIKPKAVQVGVGKSTTVVKNVAVNACKGYTKNFPVVVKAQTFDPSKPNPNAPLSKFAHHKTATVSALNQGLHHLHCQARNRLHRLPPKHSTAFLPENSNAHCNYYTTARMQSQRKYIFEPLTHLVKCYIVYHSTPFLFSVHML